jgi:hypothetical protein
LSRPSGSLDLTGVRNTFGLMALLVALLALAVLGGTVYATREQLLEVSWLEAATAVPLVALLALLALAIAGRGKAYYQETLGRVGGTAVIRAARGLGLLALLLSVTAALALGVFGVLVWTDGLTHPPW